MKPILIDGGVVDSDDRGNVRVIMTNLSDSAIEFETRDRIAQVLFIKNEDVQFEEVYNFDDFQTDRGSKGFDSSGK